MFIEWRAFADIAIAINCSSIRLRVAASSEQRVSSMGSTGSRTDSRRRIGGTPLYGRGEPAFAAQARAKARAHTQLPLVVVRLEVPPGDGRRALDELLRIDPAFVGAERLGRVGQRVEAAPLAVGGAALLQERRNAERWVLESSPWMKKWRWPGVSMRLTVGAAGGRHVMLSHWGHQNSSVEKGMLACLREHSGHSMTSRGRSFCLRMSSFCAIFHMHLDHPANKNIASWRVRDELRPALRNSLLSCDPSFEVAWHGFHQIASAGIQQRRLSASGAIFLSTMRRRSCVVPSMPVLSLTVGLSSTMTESYRNQILRKIHVGRIVQRPKTLSLMPPRGWLQGADASFVNHLPSLQHFLSPQHFMVLKSRSPTHLELWAARE